MSANSRRVTVSRDFVVVGRFSASIANVPGGGARAGYMGDSSESESVALDSELEMEEEACVSGTGSGECCDLSSSEICSGGVIVGGCGSE